MVEKDNVQTVYSGAQVTTVNSKSFIEIFFGWFTNTFCAIKFIFVKQKDAIYVNPDISIELTSAAIGVISYSADSRGNARIKLILPENCTKLNHFRQTLHNTEFLVTFTGNHTGISNLGRSTTNSPQTTTNNPGSTQTETSISNLGSTRNVHQITTNNYGSIQTETSIHGSRKSAYQTDEDEASSTQSENSIHGSRKSVYQTDEDEASSTQAENSTHSLGSMESVEKTNEYKTNSGQSKKGVYSLLGRKNERKESKRINNQRTAIVALKWNKTERFVVNKNTGVRHTAEYQTEGCSYSEETCRIFKNKCGLFSEAAFHNLLKNSNKIDGRWSVLSLSKNENHLHFERIDDLPTKILYQITEPLQNQKDGKQRKRLTDITLEVEDRAKHQESELEQKGPTNSTRGDLNIDDIETDDNIQQNLESYIPEEQIPRDQIQTVSSKKKQNEQWWTERTKMKQAKVKTRSQSTELKIYLQSQDDAFRDLLNDFFRDDTIRHCVHDFFERDVDHTKKGVFERPHIQWPSMHPRLPFKLRYLDEHVEDSESGNQDHAQQQQFTPTASGEYNEERSSDIISVKSDSSDDETK